MAESKLKQLPSLQPVQSVPTLAIHGSGCLGHGKNCILILRVLFKEECLFVIVDAHSRDHTNVLNTKTIEVLSNLLASYELPEQVHLDNGPQFLSQEFTMEEWSQHIRSTPYNPSTNGLVECFILTFKRAMQPSQHDNRPLQHQLADFLK